MKLKDIEVGGRYRAKVSGRLTTVRVVDLKESSTFGGRYSSQRICENTRDYYYLRSECR